MPQGQQIRTTLGSFNLPGVEDYGRQAAEGFLQQRARGRQLGQRDRALDLQAQQEQRLGTNADRSFALQQDKADLAFIEVISEMFEEQPEFAAEMVNADTEQAARVRNEMNIPEGVEFIPPEDAGADLPYHEFRNVATGKVHRIPKPSKTFAQRKADLLGGLPPDEQRQAAGLQTTAEKAEAARAVERARAEGRAAGTPRGAGKLVRGRPGDYFIDPNRPAGENIVAIIPPAPTKGTKRTLPDIQVEVLDRYLEGEALNVREQQVLDAALADKRKDSPSEAAIRRYMEAGGDLTKLNAAERAVVVKELFADDPFLDKALEAVLKSPGAFRDPKKSTREVLRIRKQLLRAVERANRPTAAPTLEDVADLAGEPEVLGQSTVPVGGSERTTINFGGRTLNLEVTPERFRELMTQLGVSADELRGYGYTIQGE